MFIYGGNMKKQKIFLKNKQLLGFYLVVGVLFSVISVVAPSISGELVNAVIYRQGDVKVYLFLLATVYKGNIIKTLIMDCQSYTKYRPNETTGGIFVSWRRKEELPTGA